MDENCTLTVPNSEETGSQCHARFRNSRENRNVKLGVLKKKPAGFKPERNGNRQMLTVVLGSPLAEGNQGLQSVLEEARGELA